MAKPIVRTKKGIKQKREMVFPLEKSNLIIIGLGILLLIIGYIFMTQNSVDGFLPTVAAPILLVVGYCIVIPYGIIKKPSKKEASPLIPKREEKNISTESTPQVPSSNIKTR